MKKTAIVLGASGLTGSNLLNLLLSDDSYECVKVFVRKPLEKSHQKLKQIVCNLFELEKYADEFKGDELYCCIGTTKAKTPDKKLYKDIDCGIANTAAKLAQDNDISTCSFISSVGADKNSLFFYFRVKGQMEESVLKYDIKNIFIYRPCVICGDRQDTRITEALGIGFLRIFKYFLKGKFARYNPISSRNLAKAMILGSSSHTGKKIIYLDKI